MSGRAGATALLPDSERGGGTIWVQLLKDRKVDGKLLAAGSWVDIGKQAALQWITEGSAIARGTQKVELPPDCGVVARGEPTLALAGVGRLGLDLPIESVSPAGELPLPFGRTLLWRSDRKLRVDLIPAGFGMLERWEVAVPLWSHERIAAEVGTPEDRERTQAVVRDLRVPLYEPGVIFARQCAGARALLDRYQAEREGSDERLAFLRALYATRPLVLALPQTWVE